MMDSFFSEIDQIIKNKASIMLVEDDLWKRTELEEFCLTENLLCYSFTSADEALTQVKIIKPDLIITDWKLPGILDGLAFVKRIRSQYAKDVPILFMTACAEDDTQYKALEARATSFIDKQARIEILDEQIKSLLLFRAKGCKLDEITTPQLFKLALKNSDLEIIKQVQIYSKKYFRAEQSIKKILAELDNLLLIKESKVRAVLKKNLDTSPQQFVISYGLFLATKMLLDDISVQEISYNLGYKDDSNFSHAFKKKYKLSPKEYKQLKLIQVA
ncbi:response regulator transcription factor [Litorilituus lipolyticus]|uniref:Response regulator transcription factor n=1 Tax=Litorilituus lipolyticus TaxID=2491017 RepID=A0A502L7S9_9GAMM|nr:response regulator transcription factor [Litorilituus lipolyticus]TPH18381.1 response regulator transcription factor [Litorilituus lipolyticus]